MKRKNFHPPLCLAAALAFICCPGVLQAQEPGATTALDTVVVTSGRTAETLREVPSSVTIITGEKIEKSTANNLYDVLTQEGFSGYTGNAGISNVSIRGLSNGSSRLDYDSRVLLLVNGHRTGYNSLELVGVANIERVEIIRGPAAVQYGSTAMGGVINVITKRAEDGVTATLEAGIGSFGYSTEKLSLLAGGKGLDLSLGLEHSTRDDYDAGGDWGVFPFTSYKHDYRGDVNLGYTFNENHRLGIHTNFNIREDSKNTSYIVQTLREPHAYTNMDRTSTNSTLSYDGSTADKRFSWLASYTKGSYEYDDRRYVEPDGHLNQNYNQTTGLDQFTAQGTMDLDRFALTLGYDYLKYTSENPSAYYTNNVVSSFTQGSSTMENNAVYLLGKLRFLDDSLVFSAGGRFDQYKYGRNGGKTWPRASDTSVNETNFIPSVGVTWSPTEYLKLRANYAEGFLMPTPNMTDGGGVYYLPSPGLKPEKSKTYEIGADYYWDFIDASLTFYRTDYTDKLATKEFPGRKFQYLNLDGAVIDGLELSLGADLGAAFDQDFRLRPYASVNLLWAENQETEQPPVSVDRKALAAMPKFTGAFGVDFSHPASHLDINLNMAYIGKSWSQSWLADQDKSPGWQQWEKRGDWKLVDLSIGKRVWDFEDKGYVTLKVKANNLLDEGAEFMRDSPIMGRNFYVGLAYTY